MAKKSLAKEFLEGLNEKSDATEDDDKAYESYRSTLPENQRLTKDPDYEKDGVYRQRRYWELGGKPKDFEEAKKRQMFTMEDDGAYHARSVAYNKEKDEYEFMKAPNHPTLKEELKWYNGDKNGAPEFRNNYGLDKSGKYYKYYRKYPSMINKEEDDKGDTFIKSFFEDIK